MEIYIKKIPQINTEISIEYQVTTENILITEIEAFTDGYTAETIYYNLDSIELDKVYYKTEWIRGIQYIDNKLHLEVLYPTNEDEFKKNKEYNFEKVEKIELEIQNEITDFEELIIPEMEVEPSPLEKLESDNRALTLRVEELKREMESNKRTNEEMTLELLDLMMGLI